MDAVAAQEQARAIIRSALTDVQELTVSYSKTGKSSESKKMSVNQFLGTITSVIEEDTSDINDFVHEWSLRVIIYHNMEMFCKLRVNFNPDNGLWGTYSSYAVVSTNSDVLKSIHRPQQRKPSSREQRR